MDKKEILRKQILGMVKKYYQLAHQPKEFIPGQSTVHYSGKVYDHDEMVKATETVLDFWLTEHKVTQEFEKKLAAFIGTKYCVFTNSGSSANLLAISALTSHLLGEQRLKPGDEVITVAAGFPTTVNPLIQNGLIPVFVDIDLGTYNINIEAMKAALSPKTKAVFVAHTLGNPFNLTEVINFCQENKLWLAEDNCDAYGSEYKGQKTGSFGHVSTTSFFPAHMMTTIEGGAVFTNDSRIYKALGSFKSWGKSCYCIPGKDNTCCKRFDQPKKVRHELPEGYDHKFIFDHIGYNLKTIETQAAIGLAQLEKLPGFIEKRKNNFKILYTGLKKHEKHLLLPDWSSDADPSWFGFLISVKPDASFTKKDLVNYLEANKIVTRPLFAGNLTRHPGYKEVNYRIVGSLENTDYVMMNTFFIGVYPGLTQEMLDYMLQVFDKFFEEVKE